METNKTNKTFDAVKMMRTIRDKISAETKGMTLRELKEYMEIHLKKNAIGWKSNTEIVSTR